MNINIHGTRTGRFPSTALNRSNTPKADCARELAPSDRAFDWLTDAVAGVPFDRDFDAARSKTDPCTGRD